MSIGPSLEDLLSKSDQEDDEGKESQLQKKIKQITIKEKEQETEKKADSVGLPYLNLVGFGASPDALSIIPKEQSKELKTICFFNDGKEIRLGTVDQTNDVKKLEVELKEKHHANVATYLISQSSFDYGFKLYDALPEIRKFIKGIAITEEEIKKYEAEIKTFRDLNEKLKKASITELVTLIIAGAIKSRASDIHIEAEEKDIKVRYRIDGVLNDVAIIDKETWPKIDSRIKQLAKLKINVSNRPQDGRFAIYLKDDRVDVRVSALPTGFGESIVIRLLMSSAVGLSFEDLGIRGRSFKTLEREIKRPNGMIITTGPTGSGKTTTLYAILKKLNNPETKIITIEDPIEYVYPPAKSLVSQRELYQDAPSWNIALKAALREDPDVVLVGEMRDYDSIQLVLTLAETGHLVFSSLHTGNTVEAINRIVDVFPSPQQAQIRKQLSSVLKVVIAQRLITNFTNTERIPALEILLNNSAVATIVRDGRFHMLNNVIATSEGEGMILFENYLLSLLKRNLISKETAVNSALRPKEFSKLMNP